MISLNEFLSAIQENARRITHYETGGDGSGGGCDCIGLIIGALRLEGEAWRGAHGSNWAARNAVSGLNAIGSAENVFLGEIVFKAKEPGESGYDLPEAYEDSPDRRDYYHVGVVTGVSPLCVTHCTGVEGGIQRDAALGQWKWGGKLNCVSYDAEGEDSAGAMYRAIVTADNGYPVKMREGPSQKSRIMAVVPLGSRVNVLREENADWSIIAYNGMTGCMMSRFLRRESGGGAEDAAALLRSGLEEIRDMASRLLSQLNERM